MGHWEVVLYVVAIGAAVSILTPAIAFSFRATRLRNYVTGEQARAEPTGDDPDYERRFRQFAALGFRAAGTSRETAWFPNPLAWRWRSKFGIRWMSMPDGKTFVSFHRLIAIEPVRISVVTMFEGGGLIRSTCPGTGINRDTDTAVWAEYQNIEPADLLVKHQQNVDAFSRRRGRTPRSATLAEIIAEDAAQDAILLRSMGWGGYLGILLWFILPALLTPRWFSLPGTASQRAALGVCIGAATFAFMRLVVWPLQRSRAVMRTHAPRNPTPGATQ